MSNKMKASILVIIAACILQATACTNGGKSDQEIEAQMTLDAIYAEGTAQAAIPVTGGNTLEDEALVEEKAIEILLYPGENLPETLRTLADSDSSLRASEKRVLSGDKFLDSLYERPFTAVDMIYQPDLDIYTVDFAVDEQFYYFTINLKGMNPDNWGLNGIYAIEIDTDLDGRGEVIIATEKTAQFWDIDSVRVLVDVNGDVGGPKPIIADAGFNGSGYDEIKQIAGNEVAFARIDPQSETSVQIAVSTMMLGDPAGFAWSAWADNGLRDFSMFDYNDTMGPSAAGSPFRDDPNYPIKGLFSVDNTCRLAYGDIGLESAIPGICIIGVPTVAPSDKCTWRCTDPRGKDPTSCARYQGQWVCR
jgi:hypothetical protein